MTKAAVLTIILLLIASPIAVAYWLRRQQVGYWIHFSVGALAFLAAEIGGRFLWDVPLSGALWLSIFLLVQALLKEGALYLAYRFFLSDIDSEREALMVGVGRIGAGMIMVSLSMGVVFLSALSFANADLSSLDLAPEEIADYQQQVDLYWADSPLLQLGQAAQASLDFPVHLILPIILLGAFRDKDWRAFGLAVGIHFALLVLSLLAAWVLGLLGWIVVVLLFDAGAVWFLRQQWPSLREQIAQAQKRKAKA